ncbi:LysR family transcriptional regulator [Pseudorhodoferax sp.]|uniref:LysR family transcriptional regulator n=1 Tax=Pseudorhodoferax sp. TaxID=1993553 RepID=UPI0039E56AB7
MDLQSLALFAEIVDCGSLSDAGRKFRMSRANVSYHLSRLEKSVGVQLLRRTTRRVEPTEIGLKIYQHARNIQDEMLAVRETVASLGQELQGRVGLSVPSGYGEMVMGDWLIDFKRLYPGIVLDVLFENRADNLRDDVDISIRVIEQAPPSLVARSLGEVRYLACAARAYADVHRLPSTLPELRIAPVITSGVVGRQLRLSAYRGSERHEVMLEPVLVSEHFPFLRKGILAGLGVGLVPDYVVLDKVATGEIVTTLTDYRLSIFGTHMYLLYMPNRHQTRAVRTCIEYLLRKAHAGPGGAPAKLSPTICL